MSNADVPKNWRGGQAEDRHMERQVRESLPGKYGMAVLAARRCPWKGDASPEIPAIRLLGGNALNPAPVFHSKKGPPNLGRDGGR